MIALEMEKLVGKIELLRQNLHDIVSRKGMRSSETIKASQMLDNKINEYHYLVIKSLGCVFVALD